MVRYPFDPLRAGTILEKYPKMFGILRTDRGRDRYPEITYHRAPHKPFLLLSIIDPIAQGRITETLIEPSFEIGERYEVLESGKGENDRPIFTPSEDHTGRPRATSIITARTLS